MPRIRFRWILQRFVIPLPVSEFFFFAQCQRVISFLLGTKYSICKCMNFLLLLHIFHLIWISSDNIFLIQPRWSSKAWWSVLQPKGGQGKHSPWGETIFKQFIRQVIYRRTACNKQIEASCFLKIESDYITLLRQDGHELGPDINQQNLYVLILKIVREKQANTFNKPTLIWQWIWREWKFEKYKDTVT